MGSEWEEKALRRWSLSDAGAIKLSQVWGEAVVTTRQSDLGRATQEQLQSRLLGLDHGLHERVEYEQPTGC